jgi:predicted dehydrogenase
MRITTRLKHCLTLSLLGLGLVPTNVAALFENASGPVALQRRGGMAEVKLITLDPGHFHAALVQKEMYPGVSKRVTIYAPLGADLVEHLKRIALFNTRKEGPTSWELDVHTDPDPLGRLLKERPGNAVVISGRNRGKIDRIKASVSAGLNVLADKPWVCASADLPKLQAALDEAEGRGLVAYDIMTERFEITTMIQKELVNDPQLFGAQAPGTEGEPGVYMESVHHVMKLVAGMPNLRPSWFFDIDQQGEAFADVGTHLVDLVQWTLFPEQVIDYRSDIRLLAARRWPTVITRAEFRRVTGEADFPPYLAAGVTGDRFDYYANNEVSYQLRGVHTRLKVVWNYEAPAGAGDTHFAVYRGTTSRVEVRQAREQNYRPELYVVPNTAADKPRVLAALKKRIQALQSSYPGLALEDQGGQLLVTIPEKYRVGHEAHFAQVTKQFLGYLKNPKSLPAWEKANMLAKYYTTTKGVELSRKN